MRLPEVDQSPEPLYRLCYAAVQSNLLITAVKLNIFNYLSTPKTAQAVAKQIQGHAKKHPFVFKRPDSLCPFGKK